MMGGLGKMGLNHLVGTSAAPGALTNFIGGAAGSGKVAAGGGLLGSLSLSGVAGMGGVALGGMGLASAASDLSDAAKSFNQKEKRDKTFQGATKFGMVGTGTALGAAIGSIVPGLGTALGTAIGAGLGGLGAIFSGGSLGKWFSDLTDSTAKIRETSEALREARVQFENVASRSQFTSELIEEYRRLDEVIRGGAGSTEDLAIAQAQMRDITAALSQLYPELITQYDIERGKLTEKLGLIEQISEAEKSTARLQLQQQIYEGQDILPDVEQKLRQAHTDRERILAEYEVFAQATDALTLYRAQAIELNQTMSTDEIFEQYDYLIQATRDAFNSMYSDFQLDDQGVLGLLLGGDLDIHNQRRKDLYTASENERQNIAELEEAYGQLYDAQKRLIEMDLGGSLEEMASKFYGLDEAQQGAFLDAIAQFQELERRMELLPDTKVINIELVSSLMNESNPYAGSFDMHADGGILTRPHMGLVAEAGPEGIIPLSPGRRARGLELWEQTGRILGVRPYAEGGIAGAVPVTTTTASTGASGVNIQVSLDPVFQIDGNSSPEEIMAVLRSRFGELVDDISDEIAGRLGQAFSNTPA